MPRRSCCIAVLVTVVLAACEPAADTGTPTPADTLGAAAGGSAAELAAADREAITAASQRWVRGVRSANWDSVASVYSDDAVVMPPNAETVEGRAGVRDLFASFPQVRQAELQPVHTEGRGDLAYVHGTYRFTFSTPDGQTVDDRGKYIEIWKRQPDGQWRITRDIFNSDLPAQPEG